MRQGGAAKKRSGFRIVPDVRRHVEDPLSSSSFIGSLGGEHGHDFQDYDVFPASPAQQQLWFLAQLEPDTNAAYNVQTVVRLSGTLNRLRLQKALNAVLDRHESLRTGIALVDSEPRQVVLPSALVTIPVLDRTTAGPAEVRRITRAEAGTRFSLAEPPLLRAVLIRLAEQEHVLVVTVHHVVCDGWSMELFFQDLAASYLKQAGGADGTLPELPIQYADYTVWQQERALAGEVAYWRDQLAGVAPLDLPTDRPRPPLRTVRGAVAGAHLSADLVRRLEELASRHGATLFMVLLAGFAALLARRCGQRDVAVGTPVAGRQHPDAEQLIGFFANTLVLRCRLDPDPSFDDVLRDVTATCVDAFSHQEVPLARLVEELKPARDLSRTPLFQVMFALQNTPGLTLDLPDLRLAVEETDTDTAKFELWLTAIPAESGHRLRLEYNVDLFDAATAQRLLDDYVDTLGRIVEAPRTSVWTLAGADEPERAELATETGEQFDPSGIEAVLARHPAVDRAAVVVSTIDDEPRLVGWLARDPGTRAGTDAGLVREVRAAAGEALPAESVPVAFGVLDALPCDVDGLIDRDALCGMASKAVFGASDTTPPRNGTERAVAQIFRDTLRLDAVGVHANFFGLGGHSLLAAKIIASVRSELGVLVPMREFFRRPTVAGLAEAVGEAEEARLNRRSAGGARDALAGVADSDIDRLIGQLR